MMSPRSFGLTSRDRRAYQHVHAAVRESLEGLGLLRLRPEAREDLDSERERREAVRESREVLLGEDGRGAQHHDLAAVLTCLEHRADGHLGLAVADVAAHEPVHGLAGLHVRLHVRDRGELVRRLDVREGRLHLALPGGVGGERMTGRGGTPRIQVDEVESELAGSRAGLGGAPAPVGRVQPGDARGARIGADVLRDPVELVDRHEELVAVRVLKVQVVTRHAADLAPDHGSEVGDTVGGMDDVVPRAEFEREQGHVRDRAATRRARERVVDAHDSQARVRDDEARGHIGDREVDDSLAEAPRRVVSGERALDSAGVGDDRQARLGERPRERLALTTVVRGHDDPVPGLEQAAQSGDGARLAARDVRPPRGDLRVGRASRAQERQEREALATTEVDLPGLQEVPCRVDVRGGRGLDDLVGTAGQVAEDGARLGDHHERVSRDVVGGRGELLVDAGQIGVHPVEVDALRDEIELVRELGVAERLLLEVAEGGAVRVLDVLAHRAREPQLAAREDLRVRGVADRLARARDVLPQRLDLIADQLSPHGIVAVCGKDVERAAAHCERARVLRVVEPLVAHTREFLGRLGEVDLRTRGQRQRAVDLGRAPGCEPAEQ
jgi:hypothetical protein